MGSWSCTILGSDYTLDILDEIKDYIEENLLKNGIDIEDFSLYPLENVNQLPNYEAVQKVLIDFVDRTSKNKEQLIVDDEYFMVLSSVLMAFGVEISSYIKERAKEEALDDDWAEDSEERKAYMDAFIEALDQYQKGVPLYEPTEGLFDKIFGENNKTNNPPSLKWKTD